IMKLINSQIHVDGFSFDFWWNLKGSFSVYAQNAISYAHSQGQFIAGSSLHSAANVYPSEDIALSGLGQDQSSLESQDINFIQAVRSQFGSALPIVFHIASNPSSPPPSGGNYWVSLTTAEREAEITSVVNEIFSNSSYSNVFYSYPVASPLYPVYVAYDANQDGNMLSVMNQTLTQYS
ncbi:MAG TPA: hypothetical protein VJN71_00570, partial [Nitrososphaerales archaeon]|nr:hypothetical protein [Nitrososphaerales archaeon]